MIQRTLIAACIGALVAAPAAAKTKAPPQSPLVQSLASCRSQPDDAARLRCYDAAAAALTDAATRGAVVLVDREDVRKTRRSLFGFSLPKLPFFGGDDSADDQQDEITAKVTSVRALQHGKWQMKLEDGALWETTEVSSSVSDPRAGNTVWIKKGPLGSYMMRIQGQRALRAKRVG